ncbi:hypothetical protein, partial [Ralstonia pseudosolanacearum]|uniref:hypothetical protein n=1 Tax=Ralstonia pseudosolanacearum TaxID=1310165 RepID=UPI0020044162
MPFMTREPNWEKPLLWPSEAVFGALGNGADRSRAVWTLRSGARVSLICCVTDPMAWKRFFGIFGILRKARWALRETLINGVREWNREPSCSRFPHRGKEVPIEHVFRRFRVVPGA